MKKQFFVNSLIYFIAIVLACLVNFIGVSSLAVKIVNLFIVVDFYASAIISLIMAFVVVAVWLARWHTLKRSKAVNLFR